MAKRTNWVAWGLSAILAVLLLGGIAGLCPRHVVLLRYQEWGVGREYVTIGDAVAPDGQHFLIQSQCLKVWFVVFH